MGRVGSEDGDGGTGLEGINGCFVGVGVGFVIGWE